MSELAGWDWSAIIAALALALAAGNTWYNIRQARNKPVDARQRALRDNARTVLKAANEAAKPLVQVLRNGDIPSSSEPPEELAKAHDKMVAITRDGLKVPDSTHALMATTIISYIPGKWTDAQAADQASRTLVQDAKEQTITQLNRMRAHTLMGLLDMLTQFIEQADEMLEALAQIDDGDRNAIKKWRKPRKSL